MSISLDVKSYADDKVTANGSGDSDSSIGAGAGIGIILGGESWGCPLKIMLFAIYMNENANEKKKKGRALMSVNGTWKNAEKTGSLEYLYKMTSGWCSIRAFLT